MEENEADHKDQKHKIHREPCIFLYQNIVDLTCVVQAGKAHQSHHGVWQRAKIFLHLFPELLVLFVQGIHGNQLYSKAAKHINAQKEHQEDVDHHGGASHDAANEDPELPKALEKPHHLRQPQQPCRAKDHQRAKCRGGCRPKDRVQDPVHQDPHEDQEGVKLDPVVTKTYESNGKDTTTKFCDVCDYTEVFQNLSRHCALPLQLQSKLYADSSSIENNHHADERIKPR
mmetsp:Transcript_65312/g.117547  ORF Transcript_65312/g.117547 Transcript_65312/m.117547 type:complete len:229 (-) Transcript_65312:337-1023(-)